MDASQFKELTDLIETTVQKAVEAMKTDNATTRAKCEALAADLTRMKGVFGRFDQLLGKITELNKLTAAAEASGKDNGAKIVEMRGEVQKEITSLNQIVKAIPLAGEMQLAQEGRLTAIRMFGGFGGKKVHG